MLEGVGEEQFYCFRYSEIGTELSSRLGCEKSSIEDKPFNFKTCHLVLTMLYQPKHLNPIH